MWEELITQTLYRKVRRTDGRTDRQGQILMPPHYRHGDIKYRQGYIQFLNRQTYDHVISKSRYIQKGLEQNFRKLFGLVHRGYVKKIGCLVLVQIQYWKPFIGSGNIKEK